MSTSPKALPRVISLLPSATELLAAAAPSTWRGMLVGKSHECDFPHGLASTPVLTASRVHASAAAAKPWADIDAQVSAAATAGTALFSIDEALLASLAPDVILTQDVCEVCAIELATVHRIAEHLPHRCEVLSLGATTVEGIFDDLLRVGAAVGCEASASTAVVRLRERMFEASEFVNPYADAPPVALLEWTDPLFCAGHWSVQLLERAGASHPWNPTRIRDTAGAAMGPQQGERIAGKSVRITPEQLAQHDPQWIIIAPCGLSLAQTQAAARELLAQAWFQGLSAVQHKRVALVDGNQWFNRPGPRVVDAFEWLVGLLQGVPLGKGQDIAGIAGIGGIVQLLDG
jgi:iron complex transport system substrate-binding protein